MLYEKVSGVIFPVDRVINNGGGVKKDTYKKYEKINGIYRKVFEGRPMPNGTIFYKNYYNPNLTYWLDYGMANNFRFIVQKNNVRVQIIRNSHSWNTAVCVDYYPLLQYKYLYVDAVVYTDLKNYNMIINAYDLIQSSQGWAHINPIPIFKVENTSESILHVKGLFSLTNEMRNKQAFNIGIQKDKTMNTNMEIKYFYFI